MTRLSPEEAAEKYARKCMMAFIEGSNQRLSLRWITGVIRSSGVRGQRLEDIFERLRKYASNDEESRRLQDTYRKCQNQGWF